jgi:hypothetical protein
MRLSSFLTYMSLLLYPGPSYVPTYCLTVIPLSTFAYYPYLHTSYNPLLVYVLVICAYLAYCLTCPFYCTPAHTLSYTRTYCHATIPIYSVLAILYFSYVHIFYYLCLLAISLFTCLFSYSPALSTYVLTVLHTCYYADYTLRLSYVVCNPLLVLVIYAYLYLLSHFLHVSSIVPRPLPVLICCLTVIPVYATRLSSILYFYLHVILL